MDWEPRIRNDESGVAQFVRDVLDQYHIRVTGMAAATAFLKKGYDAMTTGERASFDDEVVRVFATEACARCGGGIPWEEMYAAYHNGGYCETCDERRAALDSSIARHLPDEFRTMDGEAADRVLSLLGRYWPEYDARHGSEVATQFLRVLEPLMDVNVEITFEMRINCVEAVREARMAVNAIRAD